jgi:hypothetical protein
MAGGTKPASHTRKADKFQDGAKCMAPAARYKMAANECTAPAPKRSRTGLHMTDDIVAAHLAPH